MLISMVDSLSKTYKNWIREKGAEIWFCWKQTYMHFYKLWEAQYIFVILISFIYKPEGLFITFYQIVDPYSDALNLSKTIWGTQGPCVCCTIEYSLLKRNLSGFVQNFNITIFVRFDTNLMIELKSEFEQVIHIKVGD